MKYFTLEEANAEIPRLEAVMRSLRGLTEKLQPIKLLLPPWITPKVLVAAMGTACTWRAEPVLSRQNVRR